MPEAFGCVVGAEEVTASDFVAASLSLLDEDSDAFFAIRATAIAGHPASVTKMGKDIRTTAIRA